MAGKSLKGSKSHENLKEAFAGESQANRRYLYFARVADIEGFPDIAGLFKDTADAETGHAFGHLDFIKEVGDPRDTALPCRALFGHSDPHRVRDRIRESVTSAPPPAARARARARRRRVREAVRWAPAYRPAGAIGP